MQDQYGVRLRVVPLEDVHPHEIADPAREERIKERLAADGVLRDPVVVGSIPDVPGYILLDGTNRQRALAALQANHILVQVLNYSDPHAVQLRTWCHAVPGTVADILASGEAIPDIEQRPLSPLEAPEALHDPSTLAVLLDGKERVALTRIRRERAARATQLRMLVDRYEARMRREDCDPDDAEEQTQILNAGGRSPVSLVAFPPFSRSHVVAMAMERALIPAGITRHIILSGRALRVNLPLRLLEGGSDAATVSAALQAHLARLHPRLYREPTVLFDS